MKKLLLLLTTTVWLLSNDNPHRTMSDQKIMKFGSVKTVISQPQLPAGMPAGQVTQLLQREQDEVDAIIEQRRNVANSAFIDYVKTENGFTVPMPGAKWRAFSNTWNGTYAGKIINYFIYDKSFFEKDDPEFKKNFKDEEVLGFLVDNHLGIEHASTIREAKNYNHALSLAAMIKKQEREDYEISNALTDGEYFWSSMATGLADIDVIFGVVLVLLLLNWLLALKRQHYK